MGGNVCACVCVSYLSNAGLRVVEDLWLWIRVSFVGQGKTYAG